MTIFPGMASMAGMMGNTKNSESAATRFSQEGRVLEVDSVPLSVCWQGRRITVTFLPNTLFVYTAEPFYCETLSFVENLRKAGVETGCDVYHGLYHAFDMLSPEKEVSKDAISSPEGR